MGGLLREFMRTYEDERRQQREERRQEREQWVQALAAREQQAQAQAQAQAHELAAIRAEHQRLVQENASLRAMAGADMAGAHWDAGSAGRDH